MLPRLLIETLEPGVMFVTVGVVVVDVGVAVVEEAEVPDDSPPLLPPLVQILQAVMVKSQIPEPAWANE